MDKCESLLSRNHKCWAGERNNREGTRHRCTKTVLNIRVGLELACAFRRLQTVFNRQRWRCDILETLEWTQDHIVENISGGHAQDSDYVSQKTSSSTPVWMFVWLGLPRGWCVSFRVDTDNQVFSPKSDELVFECSEFVRKINHSC